MIISYFLYYSNILTLFVKPISILFNNRAKDKNEFRATIAPIWVVLNTVMMIDYVYHDRVTSYSLYLIGMSILPLFLAIWIGNKLQKKVSQKTFLNLTYILLILSGLSIII